MAESIPAIATRASTVEKPNVYTYFRKAGLFFPEEVTAEPRTMIYRLQAFMIQNMGLKLILNTTIIACESTSNGVILSSAANEEFFARKVIICNGNAFKNLFPIIQLVFY